MRPFERRRDGPFPRVGVRSLHHALRPEGDDCLFYYVDINLSRSPMALGWLGLQKWIGIALGVVFGLGTIYLPLLVQQARVPNLMVSGTRDDNPDLASARSEGVEEDVVPWERLPILVGIIGLGVGIAYATYRLARWRQV